MRGLAVAIAVPALLGLLGGSALAAGPALLVVQPDPDVRAIVGTVIGGLAGGVLLAIVTERRP